MESVDLEREEAVASPIAGVVVDQLSVEADLDALPGGLDEVGVPFADRCGGDAGGGLQLVDRAGLVDGLPGRVAGAEVVDLDFVSLLVSLRQGLGGGEGGGVGDADVDPGVVACVGFAPFEPQCEVTELLFGVAVEAEAAGGLQDGAEPVHHGVGPRRGDHRPVGGGEGERGEAGRAAFGDDRGCGAAGEAERGQGGVGRSDRAKQRGAGDVGVLDVVEPADAVGDRGAGIAHEQGAGFVVGGADAVAPRSAGGGVDGGPGGDPLVVDQVLDVAVARGAGSAGEGVGEVERGDVHPLPRVGVGAGGAEPDERAALTEQRVGLGAEVDPVPGRAGGEAGVAAHFADDRPKG